MKNKLLLVILTLLFTMSLAACKEDEIPVIVDNFNYDLFTPTDILDCGYEMENYYGDEIEMTNFVVENAIVFGDSDNFINICKDSTNNPIVLKDNLIRSFKIEVGFDNIYPIKEMILTNFLIDPDMALKEIDIEISLDGYAYTKLFDDYSLINTGDSVNVIDFEDTPAKSIKISFSATPGTGNYGSEFFGLNDLSFFLGDGLIVIEDEEWTNTFERYSGWTGADGVFSFNLTNGNDYIGADYDTTGFIFSDTFIGEINTDTIRRINPVMVNNTLGYYDGSTNIFDGTSFDYKIGLSDVPVSVFAPDEYIGYHESNLINMVGLDNYSGPLALFTNQGEGNMWLSEDYDNQEIVIDLLDSYDLGDIYFWNYNDNTSLGVKDFGLYTSTDNVIWEKVDDFQLDEASGEDLVEFTNTLDLTGNTARYIKIIIHTNYQLIPTQVGLGKIMIFNSDDEYLFGKVSTTSTDDELVGLENTSRLWLQDGVVLGDFLYVYPILVKDFEGFFKVFKVDMLKIPIVDETLDYENVVYFDTPLQHTTSDGGTIYYGAGLLNLSASSGYDNPDGYVYLYGYKDLNGRKLTVARFLPENIEDFNKYEFYDGTTWSNDINDSFGMIDKVSPELSVSYIQEGMFAGKYMLVVMENTTSGNVTYALSDNPYGPFSDYTLLYQTYENEYLDCFTYNAKMHPHLTEPGEFLISYNVNTYNWTQLSDARIYRPRFLRLIEVKH